MAENEPKQVTVLLEALGKGDRNAGGQLFELVYDELRRMAAAKLKTERSDHTLQGTALVNEAFLKMIGGGPVEWRNRAHFFACASNAMRRILVDHARTKGRDKRGGGARKIPLDEALDAAESTGVDLVALHDALEQLHNLDERQSRVVEMKYFGGMTSEDVASVLEVSVRTVENDWKMARIWLKSKLESGE